MPMPSLQSPHWTRKSKHGNTLDGAVEQTLKNHPWHLTPGRQSAVASRRHARGSLSGSRVCWCLRSSSFWVLLSPRWVSWFPNLISQRPDPCFPTFRIERLLCDAIRLRLERSETCVVCCIKMMQPGGCRARYKITSQINNQIPRSLLAPQRTPLRTAMSVLLDQPVATNKSWA